jgi:hypothetical protein
MARPKPLADLIDACLGPALAAQGFASSDIIVAWPDIVGERLANFTQPLRIEWPRGAGARDRDARPEPATLLVRVESAFALDMQHLAPLVIERVNAHYGWRCVGRVVLKQGPVKRPATPLSPAPVLTEEEHRRVIEAVGEVGEDALRGALERLGEAVVGVRHGARTKA